MKITTSYDMYGARKQWIITMIEIGSAECWYITVFGIYISVLGLVIEAEDCKDED